MERIRANWYDYPAVYDVAFGWDVGPEMAFLERCFASAATGVVRRVFEPFCGSGRLLVPLAHRGYVASGCDMNPRMLERARLRAKAESVTLELHETTASGWRPGMPVDAVVTLIDSFRHVVDPVEVAATVRAWHAGARPGAALIVGLSVGASAAEARPWTCERDGLRVSVTVSSAGAGPQPGTTRVRAVLAVREASGAEYEIESVDPMRDYSLSDFLTQVSDAGWRRRGTYDWNNDFAPVESRDFCGSIVATFRRE